ncbi:MAG: glutamine-hydrolyzing GMP synthase, partial [Pyrinomonadaceae bacterium]
MNHELILILDFGSQYTQLIARRTRELMVYCEIIPFHYPLEKILNRKPKGIIFSGGPNSVYEADAPTVSKQLYEKAEVPILGICYGMQLLAKDFGGQVEPSDRHEYGHAKLKVTDQRTELFQGLPKEIEVWMSHGDHVSVLPEGFHLTAVTEGICAAIENFDRKIYGVQFHPEVAHTPLGKQILSNFLFGICGCSGDWTPSHFIEEEVEKVRKMVGPQERVITGLSGGVDSTVAA